MLDRGAKTVFGTCFEADGTYSFMLSPMSYEGRGFIDGRGLYELNGDEYEDSGDCFM